MIQVSGIVKYWRRNVFAAALAAKSVVADACFRQIPHWNSIGEEKENISTPVSSENAKP
jgi:hypothetical protein